MDKVFELKSISYAYLDSNPVLKGISFTVEKCEKLVLMGANGCGKSTLLKLMNGLIFPATGEISAFGSVIDIKTNEHDMYQFRQKVGFVFQNADVQLFCSSVFDEIAFAPLQLGLEAGKVEKMVEDMLREFGIWELRGRPPHRLSGGEKRKVALASVMVVKPDVLLLDEPTNDLDPRAKRWLIQKLNSFNIGGGTVVAATNDLEFGAAIASKVLVMNEQRGIEIIANPSDVFANKSLLQKVNLI